MRTTTRARTTRRRRGPTLAVAMAVATGLAMLGIAGPAFAHGWIGGSGSDLIARQAMPGNSDIGLVKWEPQSLEATGGFPETGPADGKIASAGIAQFSELDVQSATRWAKNEVSPGPHRFGWTYTAPHRTAEWRYFITKRGWDPNRPLERSSFELLQVVAHDHSAANTNPVHTITIPGDRSGYHIVLAVWEVYDTPNAFYNVVDLDISGGPSTPDTTAPTAPSAVHSMATTASSVELMWDASTDDVGVTGYRVERATGSGAFAQLKAVPGTSTLDTGLAASTTYRYRVAALDAAGNASAWSPVFQVTTGSADLPDTSSPTVPADLHSMSTTASGVELMWSPAMDDRDVVAYRVERATGSGAFGQVAQVAVARHVDTGLSAATAYRYRVAAVDAAGNVSAWSAVFSVTTANGGGTGSPPAWNPSAAYAKGDRVSHGGAVYEAVQAHQGVGDPSWISARSLWAPVG
ncbi:lytic polysaccharide monooxygenase [Agromyces sp. LHK192]|uniref:lytic polysaccharide monooxygenase n=1 Tax=Agromyces sp. LHK192 TaxID=2498704 RepID=UPI001F0BDA29|nr:lytic polysaccharide monooxygenase [Agromyces sp. LHK192]